MYDVIFNDMAEAGVAVSLNEPIHTNKYGNLCPPDKCYEISQDIKITHLEYVYHIRRMGSLGREST